MPTRNPSNFRPSIPIKEFPPAINWRVQGVVPDVQNQEQCGSCWAFSAAETLASFYAIKHQVNAPVLSPQELVDCVPYSYNCYGCMGGWPSRAMDYALTKLNGGLQNWTSYPYQGTDGQCNVTRNQTVVVAPATVRNVTVGDQTDLLRSLTRFGPVSICIDVEESFQFYQRGIYSTTNCMTTSVNHAILLYGLYQDPATGRWAYMVRNSWGTSWGVEGDVFMDAEVSNGNICALLTAASHLV
jgi:C1A family cysteine protease